MLTFGGGAAAHLTPGHHLSGTKVKMLQAAYNSIMKQFHLNRKSEFRAKMGAMEDPIWICYPNVSLLSVRSGIRADLDRSTAWAQTVSGLSWTFSRTSKAMACMKWGSRWKWVSGTFGFCTIPPMRMSPAIASKYSHRHEHRRRSQQASTAKLDSSVMRKPPQDHGALGWVA